MDIFDLASAMRRLPWLLAVFAGLAGRQEAEKSSMLPSFTESTIVRSQNAVSLYSFTVAQDLF